MSPAVSILIPAYNAESWVGQAVESALAQGPDVEVLVVDDGSTDATAERLRNFGGRISWESVPNAGAPAARNRLLRRARTPWVQYLDADDYLLPGKIDGQRAALTQHGQADVLYGPETIEWHEHGDVVHRTVQEISEPWDPWSLLALWRLPQTGAPLWRRSALLDVGGWREDQPCCQEHELYLRLLMAGKRFAYAPAGGAVYRRFANGTLSTSNMARVRAERVKILARLEQFLNVNDLMTPERQCAIDQGRFDMARSAWPEDPAEAQRIYSTISTTRFRPVGAAAPRHYRVAHRLFGFTVAERLAALRRGLRGRAPFGRPGPEGPLEIGKDAQKP